MKKKHIITRHWSVCTLDSLWWSSWNRGGWIKNVIAPCSTHATLKTKKQAIKCAMNALKMGAEEVFVEGRYKNGRDWTYITTCYTQADLIK